MCSEQFYRRPHHVVADINVPLGRTEVLVAGQRHDDLRGHP